MPHLLFKYLWKSLASLSNNPIGRLLPCFFNSISKRWHIYWTIFGRPSSVYLLGSRYTNIWKSQDSTLATKLGRLFEFSKKISIFNSINSKREQCRKKNSRQQADLGFAWSSITIAKWLWICLISSSLFSTVRPMVWNCFKNQMRKCSKKWFWEEKNNV